MRLRALSFSVPTPEAERLFLESFTSTREHFRQSLDALSAAHLHLANTDFDPGQPTKRGEYWLADDTYDELLGKLTDRGFANVWENLRSNLAEYYGDVNSLPNGTDAERKRSATVPRQMAVLDLVKAP